MPRLVLFSQVIRTHQRKPKALPDSVTVAAAVCTRPRQQDLWVAKVFSVESGEAVPYYTLVVSGTGSVPGLLRRLDSGSSSPVACKCLESVARRLSYWGYKQEGVSEGKDRKEQSRQLCLPECQKPMPRPEWKELLSVHLRKPHPTARSPCLASSLHSPQGNPSHPST